MPHDDMTDDTHDGGPSDQQGALQEEPANKDEKKPSWRESRRKKPPLRETEPLLCETMNSRRCPTGAAFDVARWSLQPRSNQAGKFKFACIAYAVSYSCL